MPKLKPFAFNQNPEAINGAIVGVEHQLGQSDNLRSAVPAVGTVHQNGPFVDGDVVDDH